MTRTMILLAALGGLFFAAPQAEAHDRFGIHFGFGNGGFAVSGGYRSYPRYCAPVVATPVHVHTRVPIYREVWVPAHYDRVLVGYDRFHRPVFRTVCVSAGHYE